VGHGLIESIKLLTENTELSLQLTTRKRWVRSSQHEMVCSGLGSKVNWDCLWNYNSCSWIWTGR